MQLAKSVEWRGASVKGECVLILDQTRLPDTEVVLECEEVEAVYHAIKTLQVRGAPAIGIAAAYGLIVGLEQTVTYDELARRAEYLNSARPTAVNLSWALNRMLAYAATADNQLAITTATLLAEAVLIHQEDIEACKRIGKFGADLLADCENILTHCNAGALAVSEFGTALAPIYTAHNAGQELHVYVDETRPLLQGARLTAFELSQNGVPYTLICDNMAAYTMSLGKVDAVIVGADRVAANGDVANKIGTLNVAILCQYYKIPFYVACPTSTVDFATKDGAGIPIEIRASDEIRQLRGQPISPVDAATFNPAFDVTPAGLVTAIITDQGVFSPGALTELKQAERQRG